MPQINYKVKPGKRGLNFFFLKHNFENHINITSINPWKVCGCGFESDFFKNKNLILGKAEYVNHQHINVHSHILDIMCYLEQLRSVLIT